MRYVGAGPLEWNGGELRVMMMIWSHRLHFLEPAAVCLELGTGGGILSLDERREHPGA